MVAVETWVEEERLKKEVAYWRERCRVHEAQHERLEQAAAEVRAAVERFLLVLQQSRPQGIDQRG